METYYDVRYDAVGESIHGLMVQIYVVQCIAATEINRRSLGVFLLLVNNDITR